MYASVLQVGSSPPEGPAPPAKVQYVLAGVAVVSEQLRGGALKQLLQHT